MKKLALVVASVAVACTLTGCLKKEQEQTDIKNVKIVVPALSVKIRETDKYVIYGLERMNVTDGKSGKGAIIKAMKNENLIEFQRVTTNCAAVPTFTVLEERATQKNGTELEGRFQWKPVEGKKTFGTAENKPESDWLCLKWKAPKDQE